MGAGAATSTQAHILGRLSADPDAKAFEILVLAALEGPEALKQALDDQAKAKPPHERQQPPTRPQAAYFSRITVEGFRGIGKKADLEIKAGPGLTLVVGRNGSGKSSFAEALELLLTKDTYRWAKRTKVWRDGWRNLHHKTTTIEAECLIEGKKGPTQIRQTWAEGQALDDGATIVQPHGEAKTDRAALGWHEPLVTHRPFLSYNELGSMLGEGPSKLFDALAQILGLDDLTDAEKTLAEERAHIPDPRAKALAAIINEVLGRRGSRGRPPRRPADRRPGRGVEKHGRAGPRPTRSGGHWPARKWDREWKSLT